MRSPCRRTWPAAPAGRLTACWRLGERRQRPLSDPALGIDEVLRALAEDRAREDVTTHLLGDVAPQPVAVRFLAEERCVVAGLPVAAIVFRELEPEASLEPCVAEGAWAGAGAVVATPQGRAAGPTASPSPSPKSASPPAPARSVKSITGPALPSSSRK